MTKTGAGNERFESQERKKIGFLKAHLKIETPRDFCKRFD
jgi:hypothetical protein